MVAAWLPGTHDAYYQDFKDDLVDLGPNLEGAKIGLVVPSYMDIDSVEDLK
ncbi:glycine betaine ABC transporter substrate-binding protein [Bacillus solitudinis]|uniref:glycine betaine ABC transporter substrate-binding protein n=1 Tax=Bacillus solitudinis TaxID=2014074 RepID=UPI0029DE8AB4|nr:glycine betaine ABC transporter substrate-binding protein [Bacillus solitudinis]